MAFKNFTCALYLYGTLIFCVPTDSYGSIAPPSAWESFGGKVLYFLGSDRCPTPFWLRRHNQMGTAVVEPDSQQAVLAVDSFSKAALEGYEDESFVKQGRIPLHKNPRCIFGLYLAEKFPDTTLSNTGKNLFEWCVQHACLEAFGRENPWKKRLETGLAKIDVDLTDDFGFEFFEEAEVPFLLTYLAENGSSQSIRRQARQLLAHYLFERYALESALNQYRLLLLGPEYADVNEHKQLWAASLFQETGAITDAKKLYGRLLENTRAREIAKAAAEDLARISLANSDEMGAWEILDGLHQRFPSVKFSAGDLKSFCLKFQADREKRLEQIFSELLNEQEEGRTLHLCRVLSSLLTEEEALKRWQRVIEQAELESTVWQCGRLYLAENLVNSRQISDAQGIVGDLRRSNHPIIRARALFVSGDIAGRLGRTSEAVALYRKAAQIERPTTLPEWVRPVQLLEQLTIDVLTVDEQSFLSSLLRGYNELIDGNFKSGATDLTAALQIANCSSSKSLHPDAKHKIQPLLVVSCLKVGDYAVAEQYGLQMVKLLEENRQENEPPLACSLRTEMADESLFALLRELRSLEGPESRARIERQAKNTYACLKGLNSSNTNLEPVEDRLVQLLWQVKRERVARLLSAECKLVMARAKEADSSAGYTKLEPAMFAAKLLGSDSFEQIHKSLITIVPPQHSPGQMYRFARFAKEVSRPRMVRLALDAAVMGIESVRNNRELLKNVADLYSAGNHYQKAVEIYEKIANEAATDKEAQDLYLRIVKVYAGQLRLYDKALQKCRAFMERFPGSELASEIEFVQGKMEYMTRDYDSAVTLLDLFQRKYPYAPKAAEAMILAATSQMFNGDTKDAIARFTEVIQKYPEGDMAARSKFLIGYAQVSEQKHAEALQTFRQLAEQFPTSRYAKQARSFVNRLGKVEQ